MRSGVFKKLDVDLEFSDIDRNLFQNLVRRDKYVYSIRGKNVKFSDMFARYVKKVPYTYRDILIKLFNIIKDLDELSLLETLSYLTVIALRRWFEIGLKKYLYMLDWNVFLGYDTIAHRDFDAEKALDVFCVAGEVKDEVLLEEVEKLVDGFEFSDTQYKFEEYISFRDDWGVGGTSSLGDKLVFEVVNKRDESDVRQQPVNDKWGNFLLWSDKKIADMSLADRNVYVNTFVKKDEVGKARLVQGYDVLSYIRCSYIEKFIKNLNVYEWTSIGYGPKQNLQMWRDLTSITGVRLAVDQSKFDLHQSKELVVGALKLLYNKMKTKISNKDLHNVIDVELRSLENVYLKFGSEGVERKWKNGLLSGYKFTALLGSILNCAAFRYVVKKFENEIIYSRFQGDDAVSILKRDIDVEIVAKEYEKIGKKINVKKSWKSNTQTDYLHLLFNNLRGTVEGYPARAIKSLLWKKPGRKETYNVEMEINNMKSTCLKAERRGLVGCDRILKKYIRQKVFIDGNLDLWIYSKSVYGGAGFGNLEYEYVLSEQKISKRFELRLKNPELYDAFWFDGFSKYVEDRYKDKLPIRTEKRTMSFRKVKYNLDKDAMTYRIISDSRGAIYKVEWDTRDLIVTKDAYIRQLKLKSSVLRIIDFENYFIPSDFLRNLFKAKIRYLKLLRLYRGLIFSMDNMYNEETLYYVYKSTFYKIWKLYVGRIVVMDRKKDFEAIDYKSLVYSWIGQIRTFKRLSL